MKTIKIIIEKKEIEIKVKPEDMDLLLKIISVFGTTETTVEATVAARAIEEHSEN